MVLCAVPGLQGALPAAVDILLVWWCTSATARRSLSFGGREEGVILSLVPTNTTPQQMITSYVLCSMKLRPGGLETHQLQP